MRIYLHLFVLFTFNLSLLAQKVPGKKPMDVSYLNIYGEIANTRAFDSCTVDLLRDNRVESVIRLKGGEKKFNFKLVANEFYTLRISKTGFVTSLICIDTKCPSEIVDDFDFKFDINLVSEKEAKALKKDVLDFPIAIVYFDPKTEDFVHNEEYTRAFKTEAGLSRSNKNQSELNIKF